MHELKRSGKYIGVGESVFGLHPSSTLVCEYKLFSQEYAVIIGWKLPRGNLRLIIGGSSVPLAFIMGKKPIMKGRVEHRAP